MHINKHSFCCQKPFDFCLQRHLNVIARRITSSTAFFELQCDSKGNKKQRRSNPKTRLLHGACTERSECVRNDNTGMSLRGTLSEVEGDEAIRLRFVTTKLHFVSDCYTEVYTEHFGFLSTGSTNVLAMTASIVLLRLPLAWNDTSCQIEYTLLNLTNKKIYKLYTN